MTRFSTLVSNLYKQRDETGDVTFIVQTERIRAHRCVLATLSEKYKAQFFGPQPDQGDIQVDGVTAAAFKEFLKLFYSNKFELSIENIADVLDLVKQSLIDDFVTECINFLKRKVAIDNVCSIYRLASAYDVIDLKESCERKISDDTEKMFATEDFANCDRETLEMILKLNLFSCTENEVFDACISWARGVCVKKLIDSSNPANLRAELGDAVTQFRFKSMKLEEFTDRYKLLEGFFTTEECTEIYNIIGNMADFQPQKFSQMLRELNVQAKNCLECNRRLTSVGRPSYHTGVNNFHFKCDKSIRLHGFVIGFDYIDTVDVQICENDMEWKKIAVSVKKAINETTVALVEPIDIVPNQLYKLYFLCMDLTGRSFDTFYQNGKIWSNGILFTFENSDKFSFVSRLLFTRLNFSV